MLISLKKRSSNLPYVSSQHRSVYLTPPALDDKIQSLFFFVIAVNIPPKNKAANAIAPKLNVYAF
jgi:hypothetical protein